MINNLILILILILIILIIILKNLFFAGAILIGIIVFVFFNNKIKEKWCNTYSGWPGPLENPYQTNIPALYGNPKYMSKCKYKYTPNSNSNYLSMKNLP